MDKLDKEIEDFLDNIEEEQRKAEEEFFSSSLYKEYEAIRMMEGYQYSY